MSEPGPRRAATGEPDEAAVPRPRPGAPDRAPEPAPEHAGAPSPSDDTVGEEPPPVGGLPGDDPGSASGDDPGSASGEEPGNASGEEPGSASGDASGEEPADDPGDDGSAVPPPAGRRRRRREPLAAALIGVLTLLLGFAFAVQVRSTDQDTQLSGAREEDLVRILDEQNAQEDRLRQQIAEQRTALEQLMNSDSRSATALTEARQRAEAIGILNGTLAAQGPGLRILISDPDGAVRVADLLDAIQELRGAGAETMQIDDVRIGVSTAITGAAGDLSIDGAAVSAPYEILVIGSPQDLETAMNIPGGVVQRINGRGGSVQIAQTQQVVVDALRPLDQPQYAAPETDGG